MEPLCKTCLYDADDSCTFPNRPDARECTLYRDVNAAIASPTKRGGEFLSKAWLRRNLTWIVLIGLIVLSVLLTLA